MNCRCTECASRKLIGLESRRGTPPEGTGDTEGTGDRLTVGRTRLFILLSTLVHDVATKYRYPQGKQSTGNQSAL